MLLTQEVISDVNELECWCGNDQKQQAIQQRLRESSYSPLWRLKCQIASDRIVLAGAVPSYYMKQMAQTIALGQAGDKAVENQIVVRSLR
mgnify:FL=1